MPNHDAILHVLYGLENVWCMTIFVFSEETIAVFNVLTHYSKS